MAVADIAAQGSKAIVSLPDIAARQSISLSFLEQLFAKLRRAEIVSSVRGPEGGYTLMQSPADIRLNTVIAAVDEDIKAHACNPETKLTCTGKSNRCLTHNLWGALENHIEGFLASVTVEDVVEQRIPLDPEKKLEAAE